MDDMEVLRPLNVIPLATLLLAAGWLAIPGSTPEYPHRSGLATGTPESDAPLALAGQEASRAYSVPLRWIAGPSNGQPVPGSLVDVTATTEQVDVSVTATNLEPGHAYTFWLVVFPDPSVCAAPPNLPSMILRCGFPDIPLQDALNDPGAVVALGTGVVADGDGKASFTVEAKAERCWGDPDRVAHPPQGFPLGDEPCLGEDLSVPEFQLVVRDHGPYDPDAYGEAQLTTLQGGCEDYTCRDPQSTGVDNQMPIRCFPPQPSPDCLDGWVP